MVVIESTPSSPQHPHSREISSEEDGGDEQSSDEDELRLSNAILAKKSRTEKTETEDIDIEKHQSAYEIERARRLEENKKQLLALGIFKEPTLIPAPVKPRYIEKKHKVARAAEDIPRRQSSRLAGKQEEHTGLKYRDRNYDNDDRNLFFESSEEFSDSGSEREFDSDGNPIIIKRVKNVPRSSNKGKSGNRAKFEKGKLPTGQLKNTALQKGYKSVSEMLAAEGRLVPKAKVSSKKVDQDSSGKNAKENMVVVA
ncbi:hypothetical protein HDU82_009106 [Entophlyctis luteolus]|nr:hypothetical protein HDU82_009106 [Entophlyctis luteolus]